MEKFQKWASIIDKGKLACEKKLERFGSVSLGKRWIRACMIERNKKEDGKKDKELQTSTYLLL